MLVSIPFLKIRSLGYRALFVIITCASFFGCSDPKFGLKELDVKPQYFCTGETAEIHVKVGKELNKIVIKNKHGVVQKVFKDTDEINWTTPELNNDIVQFKIKGHLKKWGKWKRKTFTSDFVNIDNPTWTSSLKDVQYSTSERVDTIQHDPGTGPVPENFGYYQCAEWDIVEHEVCVPIEDCADECWIDDEGNFVCEYRCHVVGEDCHTEFEDVCLAEELITEAYLEHRLYVKLNGLTWLINPEYYSERAGTKNIKNDNDFLITVASGGWNATLNPGATVTTPDVHPSHLSISGTIDPPVELLCATDFTKPGDKASFDDTSCDFEELIAGVRLQVYCKSTP